MDNYENENDNLYTCQEYNDLEKQDTSLNSNISNSCNIKLRETIYYPSKKNRNVRMKNNCADGKLLVLNVKLKNICPNKILILGALVYDNNNLYAFKTKKLSTLGFSYNKCKNINSCKFSFMFHDYKPSNEKKLKVKFMYQYVLC